MPRGGLAIAHRRDETDDDPREFFPTPPWATRALVERVLRHLRREGQCQFQNAWEPACGEGHMAEVLREYFLHVEASDAYEYEYRGARAATFKCDFLTEVATFSYSTDGKDFHAIGGPFTMVFQLKTFQGVRYSLFAFNAGGSPGGVADFNEFTVDEPDPRGLMRPIPLGRKVRFTVHGTDRALGVKEGVLTSVPASEASTFTIVDRSLGRVGLRAADGRLAETSGSGVVFQWDENLYGDLVLRSLKTQRYLRLSADTKTLSADGPGSDRRDSSCFEWVLAEP